MEIYNPTDVGGTLYFIGGPDLWKSDGTEPGTVVVADSSGIQFDPEGYPYGSEIVDVSDVGGVAGYVTFYADEYYTLTTPGPNGSIGPFRDIGDIRTVGRTTYFLAADNGFESSYRLYVSDGTKAGTKPLTGVWPEVGALTDASGTLFFLAHAGTTRVWKSDGTTAGTVLVKDLGPLTGDFGYEAAAANGIFYFAANDGAGGIELWKSDGTEAGTVRVKDINPGAGGSEPRDLTNVNGTVYFTANDGVTGRELWRTDGTAAGTVRVADLKAGSGDASPQGLANVNGTLFFGATDASGSKLFKLDTVMHVEGSPGRDLIVATVNGANLEVRVNGQLAKSAPVAETTLLTITAGDGDDVIDCSTLSIPVFVTAGNGNDKIAGGSAPDTLGGGAGKDTIDGGLGNDRLNGHGGHDRLFGNAGGDRLYGYDGNDLLDGGSSSDRCYGGNGSDTMFGASGNDRFFAAGDNAIDELFGGTGQDTAAVDASDVVASVESKT
jgi:ELWxxDGT repeat protein